MRGFGLVELLIALAIMAVVLAGSARYLQEQRRRAVITQISGEYVNDLLTAARGLRAYVDANKSTWAAGSVNVVPLSTLRTGGYLPTSFAARTTGDGTTPMGNTYTMVAIKAATGSDAPAVVGEVGNALAARLEAAGLAADASGMMALKRQIASTLSASVPAATIGAGTTVATGSGSNGWTKALAAYFPTAPSQPAVAALVGFPDLELEGGGGGGGEENPMNMYAICDVSLGNRFGTSGSCSAPTVTVKSWDSCQSSGFVVPVPEIGSALTFGIQHNSLGPVVTETEKNQCVAKCSGNATCENSCISNMNSLNGQGTGDAYTDYSQVSINNVIVASGLCRSRDCVAGSTLGTYSCSGQSVPVGTRDALCCEPN